MRILNKGFLEIFKYFYSNFVTTYENKGGSEFGCFNISSNIFWIFLSLLKVVVHANHSNFVEYTKI